MGHTALSIALNSRLSMSKYLYFADEYLYFADESLILDDEYLYFADESLILADESLILDDESLILADESLILDDESLILADESLILNDECLILDVECLILDDECLILNDECLILPDESLILNDECLILDDECLILPDKEKSKTRENLPKIFSRVPLIPDPLSPIPHMQITQCIHTAILVTDLQRSEHFYGTVLGLSKVERAMKFPGSWYQVGEYQIHLIAAPSVKSEPKNEKWGRNPHIAFLVSDLDAAKQQLLNYNCLIQPSASGRPAVFTQDPDGNVIELSQQ